MVLIFLTEISVKNLPWDKGRPSNAEGHTPVRLAILWVSWPRYRFIISELLT